MVKGWGQMSNVKTKKCNYIKEKTIEIDPF